MITMFHCFSGSIQQIDIVIACLSSNGIDVVFAFNRMKLMVCHNEFKLTDKVCARQNM